jgi:prophage antirepressor-like protein
MSIIKKHIKEGLGSLTTITNPSTGKTMFIAKEVAEQWGHTNLTQALKRTVSETEKLLIKKSEHAAFIKELVLNNLLSAKTQSVWLISESGLYELILASNLEAAQPFKDWVTKEVLPNIRKFGSYNLRLSESDLYKQTKKEVQIDNSKKVNAKNFEEKGKGLTIEYNQKNCEQVTGLKPSKLKELFNEKKYKSAKEVLRKHKPELAAIMSLNDHLVINNNVDLEQLREIDNAFAPAFKALINAGFQITE